MAACAGGARLALQVDLLLLRCACRCVLLLLCYSHAAQHRCAGVCWCVLLRRCCLAAHCMDVPVMCIQGSLTGAWNQRHSCATGMLILATNVNHIHAWQFDQLLTARMAAAGINDE